MLRGSEDLSVELYAGRSKGDLLENAFGRRIVLEAETAGTPAGDGGDQIAKK